MSYVPWSLERWQQLSQRVQTMLEATPREKLERQEEERFLKLRLHTIRGKCFAGQYVEDDGRLAYASLAATPEWLDA